MNKKILILAVFVIICSSSVLGALTDNLVAYWNFTTQNSFDNAYNFTNSGVNSSGIINSGRYLATGITMNTTTNLAITGATARTINMWVRNNGTKDGTVLYSYGGASNYAMINYVFTNSTRHGFDSFGCALNADGVNMANGVWKMRTFVYDGGNYNTSNVHIYENGVALTVSGGCANNLNTGGSTFQMGRYMNGDVTGLNITISELGIWNRNLSTSEILQLYASGLGNTYPFSATFSVKGNVTNNGVAFNGANVTVLIPGTNTILSSTTTNSSGQYKISGLTNNTIYLVYAYFMNSTHYLSSITYTNATVAD